MDDETPGIEIGVEINTGGGFRQLETLDDLIGETAANAVREFKRVEAAIGGLSLSGATAQVRTFGSAYETEMQAASRSTNQVEKSAEAMIRSLSRQAQTYGMTTAEARAFRIEQQAIAAESKGLTEAAARLRALGTEFNRLEQSTGGVTNAATKNRMAMQGASYQVQDFVTQVSMGANPINAFAVQGAQLAGQFSNIEGKAGNVARFFMGPWGLAITAGLMLLGPFVAKLFEGNDALDDAVDKLRKDADQTEVTAKAKEMLRRTQEGVTAAIRAGTQATEDSIKTSRTAAEQANIAAKENFNEAISLREKTIEQLRYSKALLDAQIARASGPGGEKSDLAALGIARRQAQITEIERKIAEQQALIDEANQRVQITRLDLAQETAKRLNDPIAQINKFYDDQAAAVERAARAEIAAGKQVTAAHTEQFREIERQRDLALQREQARQAALGRATGLNRQTGRQISLSEAESIVKSIGGVISSTTRTFEQQRVLYERYLAGRGPLAARPGTSDHETGNAIDIAKTPGMSLSKIREAFRAQGVAIKQLLDEGTHFHVAWKRGANDAAAASKRLADTQAALAKQFDPATAAAIEYRNALQRIAEAKLSPEDAARYAAAAREAFVKARAAAFELPSMPEIVATASEQTAAEASAKAFGESVIKPLEEELKLRGLVGAARDQAALDLQREAFIAKYELTDGIAVAEARWKEYYDAKKALIDADVRDESARRMAEDMAYLENVTRQAGDAMARAFGEVGGAIADVVDILGSYRRRQEELAKRGIALGWSQSRQAQETGRMQIGMYGDLAEAAKGFFAEKSAGWQALMAIEKVYRAFEFAMSVRAMAQDMAETLGMVANSSARAAAAGAEGVAAQSKLPFPFNIVAMAATGAALLAAGISLLGSGGGGTVAAPTSPEDLQKAAGSGSILGDSRAQSNSIANSLGIMASNSNSSLEYSNQMLRALKAIESGIGNLSGVIARQITVSGSMFDTSGLNIGQSGSAGFLGLFSSSTTRSLYDAGIDLATRTVGDIVAQGISGSTYQIVQQVKKSSGFLGIGGGTKTTYQTTTGALDGAITGAIVDVIASLRAGLIQGADLLGIAGAQALLDSFQVNIGRMSFAGMSGEEIERQLNAIFSRVGDEMAASLYPQLAEMQQIGEGAFETFMRVARQYQVVDTALASIGRTFGAVGLGSVQARDALIQLFGTMDEFVERTSFFAEKFLTEQERLAPVRAAVSAELARLGLSQVATMEQFKAVALGLDLTSEAGREMYAALMALAPAFAALHQSASAVLSERVDLERRILELQGNTAAIRALELARLDPSNRALQQQIWAIEDAQEAARAAEQLREAWSSVGTGIMEEVRRIRGLTGAEAAGGFAAAQGQFNAALAAASAGDIDAARSLPGLSQALLRAAEQQATSRQELDRIRAQTAATLEQLFGAINGANPTTPGSVNAQLANAAGAAQVAATGQDTLDLAEEVRALRAEVAGMRAENKAGHAATAGNTGAIARKLDDVTAASGGDAISTRDAA